MLYSYMEETPVGPLTLAAHEGALCKVEFRSRKKSDISDPNPSPKDEKVLRQAESELKAYFSGELREFTVPVRLSGPGFHMKVWDHLTKIPFGQTKSYGEIAAALGRPGGARAVGNACASNPVALIVPCHRVLAQNGLGGYGGGLPAKSWLLKLEGVQV